MANYNFEQKELKELIMSAIDTYEAVKHPKMVMGIKGLANLLDISIPKAQEIKNSGALDTALYQIGKKLAFDANKVLELLKVIPDK